MTTKTVLVTGARAPVALHICRLLHSCGLTVYAADSIPYALTRVSHCIDGFYQFPSPKRETARFVEAVTDLIQDLHIDLIIPTCEETFYFSLYKGHFESYCGLFVDTIDKLGLLHHKGECIRFIHRLGWNAPFTIETDGSPSYKTALQRTNVEQFVLKPVYSRFADQVQFVSREELIERETVQAGWLIQEKIEGTQYCSYSIARDGKLLGHSVYRTEFTAGAGATLAFQHVSSETILSFVSSVVKVLCYTGQIAFDYIITADGTMYPIECNPRATSGVHLFSEEVVPLFLGASQEHTIYPHEDTKMAIRGALLLYGPAFLIKRSLRRRWLSVLCSHQDTAYVSYDPKPFFYQFYMVYKLWIESKRRGISLLGQTTYDISWDGE